MIITTERLVLRPLQRDDLRAMARWPRFTDPLDLVWNWPQQLHENGTADLFWWSRALDNRRREWAILHENQVIGYLSLRDINEVERSGWLGIGFGAPYVGQGYGAEALRMFVQVCFGQLALHTLQLDVAAHNGRARRLYDRLGFRAARSWWQDAGLARDFTFLATAEYAAIRPYFRAAGLRMQMQVITMALAAGTAPPIRAAEQ